MSETPDAPHVPSFVVGRTYRRKDLHAAYGGSYQSGISASRQAPVVFLFTAESGVSHGYHDGWQPDGTFHYSGEGQLGNMQFTKGNLAIRAHHDDGRALHLFRRVKRPQPTGFVEYLGQMGYVDHLLVDGVPDSHGNPRRAIVFVLRRVESPAEEPLAGGTDADDESWRIDGHGQFPPPDASDHAILAAAAARRVAEGDEAEYDAGAPPVPHREAPRSSAVRTLVMRRAHGHCEGCHEPAPFRRLNGQPYLEAHDTSRATDLELSDPAAVIALCPNCHRRVHHGEDGPAWDGVLRARLAGIVARHA